MAISICIVFPAQMAQAQIPGFKCEVTSERAPSNVLEYLESQLNDVITSEGLASTSDDFVIELNVIELNQMVTRSAPPRTVVNLNLALKAMSREGDMVFNTMTIPASAMGSSLGDAYMRAVQSVNFRTRNFLNFVAVSRERLESYLASYVAPVPTPGVEPVVAEPETEVVPASDERVMISEGIYVEYIRYEHKSSSTDVILRFTNQNIDDEKIALRWCDQMVVDSEGKNIKYNNVSHLDGSGIANHEFVLIEGVPVTIRMNYRGRIVPRVLYLEETSRDVKVKVICK